MAQRTRMRMVDDAGAAAAAGVKNSVEIDNDDIQLVGDAASPGNGKYYGTDGDGVKGFHDLLAGGSGADGFDDVAALLASTDTSFSEGDIIRTRAEGFAYVVADPSASDEHVETAGGVKLYALRDAEGRYNVLQFGAKPEPAFDNRLIVQKIMALGGRIHFPAGEFFTTHNEGTGGADRGIWNVESGSEITLEAGTRIILLDPTNQDHVLFMFSDTENASLDGGGAELFGSRDDNPTTEPTGSQGHGYYVRRSKNITIKNLTCRDWWADGGVVGNRSSPAGAHNENIYVENVIHVRNRRQGVTITDGIDVTYRRCKFLDTEGTDPQYGLDIEPNWPESAIKNILFDDCEFAGNESGSLLIYPDNVEDSLLQIRFRKCRFDRHCTMAGSATLPRETSQVYASFEECTFENSFSTLFNMNSTLADRWNVVLRDCLFKNWAITESASTRSRSAIAIFKSIDDERLVGGLQLIRPTFHLDPGVFDQERYAINNDGTGTSFLNHYFGGINIVDPINWVSGGPLGANSGMWRMDWDHCSLSDRNNVFRHEVSSSGTMGINNGPAQLVVDGGDATITLTAGASPLILINRSGHTVRVRASNATNDFILPLIQDTGKLLESTTRGDMIEVAWSWTYFDFVIKRIVGNWTVEDI